MQTLIAPSSYRMFRKTEGIILDSQVHVSVLIHKCPVGPRMARKKGLHETMGQSLEGQCPWEMHSWRQHGIQWPHFCTRPGEPLIIHNFSYWIFNGCHNFLLWKVAWHQLVGRTLSWRLLSAFSFSLQCAHSRESFLLSDSVLPLLCSESHFSLQITKQISFPDVL